MAKKQKTRTTAIADELEFSKRILAFLDPYEFVGKITGGLWHGSPALKAMPSLLMGLYVAEQEGRAISKKAACDLMDVDVATTGPKYLVEAEDKGLIEMGRDEAKDKRKILVKLTKHARTMLDHELAALRGGGGSE